MSFDEDCRTTAFVADVLFPAQELSGLAPIHRTIIEPDGARVSRCDASSQTVTVRLDSMQCPPFWAEAVVSRENVRVATAGMSGIVGVTCRGGRLSVRPNRVQAYLTEAGLVYFSEKPLAEHPFKENDCVCYARVRLPQSVLSEMQATK
jgi:hypothetical protein